MTLAEMIARLRAEAEHPQIAEQHKAWASRLAAALEEIDRRFSALEAHLRAPEDGLLTALAEQLQRGEGE